MDWKGWKSMAPELVVALDVPALEEARRLVALLRPAGRWVKVGMEVFAVAGARGRGGGAGGGWGGAIGPQAPRYPAHRVRRGAECLPAGGGDAHAAPGRRCGDDPCRRRCCARGRPRAPRLLEWTASSFQSTKRRRYGPPADPDS